MIGSPMIRISFPPMETCHVCHETGFLRTVMCGHRVHVNCTVTNRIQYDKHNTEKEVICRECANPSDSAFR